jgi:hypothetical protein
MYTDVNLGTTVVTGAENNKLISVELYPNPVSNLLKMEIGNAPIESLALVSTQGIKSIPVRVDSTTWDISTFSSGLYIVEIRTERLLVRKKIIKL